ncbi:alpha/beta fold hydrolase [Pontixanthobacter aquaemixtae]|uniref:Alpha/beta fold hydrolase n=1 Tax=Pontixanthobacter aquaemixtae TaxID=1958940 RepID=A0A844ZQ64_9SPHN|nr:alpha/beta fold hydrolase [Pontixanthobacter aquaemixtae]MXO89684.1 alpha/beta fold hydrolase [Pontixanthobacter aquaemixtae]
MTSATMTETRAPRAPHRLLALTEPSRAMAELASFIALRPMMKALPKGDGHGVLVLPGFLAGDRSTAAIRSVLKGLGYHAAGWNLGRNIHITNERVDAMTARVTELSERTGGKISIVGWSLGGVLARELAKATPEHVRSVISLGSPIANEPGAHTNVHRLFQYFNGDQPEPQRDGNFANLADAPPVPTTSILTKGDGVVHWRGSVQHPHPDSEGQTENIEVIASHIGLGVNPSVMYAIADRLAQAEGEWKPFEARGFASFLFPKTSLH